AFVRSCGVSATQRECREHALFPVRFRLIRPLNLDHRIGAAFSAPDQVLSFSLVRMETTMLRIRTLSLSAMALALSAAPVLAADLTYEPAPAPVETSVQGFSWTGPYVGAMVGYGWSSNDASAWD